MAGDYLSWYLPLPRGALAKQNTSLTVNYTCGWGAKAIACVQQIFPTSKQACSCTGCEALLPAGEHNDWLRSRCLQVHPCPSLGQPGTWPLAVGPKLCPSLGPFCCSTYLERPPHVVGAGLGRHPPLNFPPGEVAGVHLSAHRLGQPGARVVTPPPSPLACRYVGLLSSLGKLSSCVCCSAAPEVTLQSVANVNLPSSKATLRLDKNGLLSK